MKRVVQIVYRHITSADFFNINKPTGATKGGGGQTYIDFPCSGIRPADWKELFAPRQGTKTKSGPVWDVELHSVGLRESQTVQIGQRRPASYNIRHQRITSKEANRVYAWDPRLTAFPQPRDRSKHTAIRNLVVYLAKTTSGEIWAGWFKTDRPKRSWDCDPRLRQMFDAAGEGAAGVIFLSPAVPMDETDGAWPFRSAVGNAGARSRQRTAPERVKRRRRVSVIRSRDLAYAPKPERVLLEELFHEDQSNLAERNPKRRLITKSVVRRNSTIVPKLKDLYKGHCQISGTKYAFRKENGAFYVEAHHLIPLGRGGADSAQNIIVVSPLIHRMLHHAKVSKIDLQRIKDNVLPIYINDRRYLIRWHPRHASVVLGK